MADPIATPLMGFLVGAGGAALLNCLVGLWQDRVKAKRELEKEGRAAKQLFFSKVEKWANEYEALCQKGRTTDDGPSLFQDLDAKESEMRVLLLLNGIESGALSIGRSHSGGMPINSKTTIEKAYEYAQKWDWDKTQKLK